MATAARKLNLVTLTLWFLFFSIGTVAAGLGSLFGMEKQKCAEPPSIQNFSTEFLGQWYELYTDNSKMVDLGDCIHMIYSQTDDMPIHEFNIAYMKKQRVMHNGKPGKVKSKQYITGEGHLVYPDEMSGKIEIKLSKYFNYWSPYNIIATDYHSYAIVYYCETIMSGIKKFEQINMFSRRPLDPWIAEDQAEISRIREIARAFASEHLPEYNFDQNIVLTNQGPRHGCDYSQSVDGPEDEDDPSEENALTKVNKNNTYEIWDLKEGLLIDVQYQVLKPEQGASDQDKSSSDEDNQDSTDSDEEHPFVYIEFVDENNKTHSTKTKIFKRSKNNYQQAKKWKNMHFFEKPSKFFGKKGTVYRNLRSMRRKLQVKIRSYNQKCLFCRMFPMYQRRRLERKFLKHLGKKMKILMKRQNKEYKNFLRNHTKKYSNVADNFGDKIEEIIQDIDDYDDYI